MAAALKGARAFSSPLPEHKPLKRLLGSIVDCVPRGLAQPLLAKAALLPPLLKSARLERFWARMARNAGEQTRLIETNLGIAGRVRCAIPIRKSQYVFGCPKNHLAERSTLCLAEELSKDCAHFLDVGANEGVFTFSVFVARNHSIAVHWFEPDKAVSDRLAANLRRNGIEAVGNTSAASDKTGQVTFYRNLTDDASGSLSTYFGNKHTLKPEVVNSIRLTDYIDAGQISRALVKVDVEGAATQVWSGLRESYEKISYLIIEMIAPDIENGLPAQIIRQTGWRAYYIQDFELIQSVDGEFEYIEPFWNWLFCGLEPTALAQCLSGTKFQIVGAPIKIRTMPVRRPLSGPS